MTDRLMNRQANGQLYEQIDIPTAGQTDGQVDRQANKQTDRPTHRKTDR